MRNDMGKSAPTCVFIKSMTAHRSARTTGRISAIAGLLALCFLWSLDSLRSDLFPGPASNPLPPLAGEAVPFALLALASALFAAFRNIEWPRPHQIRTSILFALGLFVVPAELVALSSHRISDLTRVALFSLVPVFAVVFEPHLGRAHAAQNRTTLLAALAAMAGTLCLYPVSVPSSIAAGLAFSALILATASIAAANCAAVAVACEFAGKSIAPLAAIAALTAATGLLLLSALTEPATYHWSAFQPVLAWSAIVELPALLLLFWLLRRMSAPRMTTRFLLAPLLTSLIGLVALRPTVDLRAGLGLFLIPAAAAWLLFAPEEEPPSSALTLKLDRN